MGKVAVHGEFSRQGEGRYLQQLQIFAHWFRKLLLLFSIHELPYPELELIGAFYDQRPVEKRTHICSVAGEVC
jgi:hypothetical protein